MVEWHGHFCPQQAVNCTGKIICVGAAKTATTSLLHAFYRLGIPSRGWDADMILAWHRGEIDKCLKRAADFTFLKDWPWQQLYRELDAQFPDSRFILTLRDPQQWVESFIGHLRRVSYAADGSVIPHPLRDKSRRMTYGFDPLERLEDRSYLIREIYEAQVTRVRRYFADRPGDLLEIDLTRMPSYAPICQFLGLPVVDWQFPHENKRPA